MHRQLTTTSRTLALAGALALTIGAQSPAQSDLLRGPEAREQGPPGAPDTFAPEERRADLREATPAMRHRLLMAALRTLDRSPEVALSADQRAAIEAQDRLYAAALQSYREANADAYGEFRPGDRQRRQRAARDGERGGDRVRTRSRERGDVEGEAHDARRAERREQWRRVRELEAAAPTPDEIHAVIWDLLDPRQQQAAEQRMDAIRTRTAERMQQGGRDRDRPGQRQEGASRLTDEQRQRLRKAMEGMSPEERREFLEQMRDRMRERRIEERSAPPMEEVEVPPPGV